MKQDKKRKVKLSKCEDCLYYDYDEDYGDNICTVQLDQDEVYELSYDKKSSCPYFRFYDEYKSVQKQN